MFYLLALVPATMLTIAGYAVLFLAQRSERGLKSVGKYLGCWAFTLAALIILGAIIAAVRGESMHRMMMSDSEEGASMRRCPYMHLWRHPPPGGAPQGMPGAPPVPPAESPGTVPPK
jgi:hypothetical protein